MDLPRVYYTLPELAEKWKRSESDLLHMAAAGELELSVKYKGWALNQADICVQLVKNHIQLTPDSIEFYLDGSTKIDMAMLEGKIIMIPTDESSLNRLKCWASEFDSLLPFVEVTPLEIKRLDDLRILPAEVERMESKFPELVGRNETSAETVDQAHKETIHPGILYDISQKELAKKCGVTARTVSNWMKGGLLFESQGREKRVSLPLAIKWLKQNDKRNELETLNNSK